LEKIIKKIDNEQYIFDDKKNFTQLIRTDLVYIFQIILNSNNSSFESINLNKKENENGKLNLKININDNNNINNIIKEENINENNNIENKVEENKEEKIDNDNDNNNNIIIENKNNQAQ
jgi:hypothetical protein